ncbi:MAG: MaoC/PaaZ C-terminal domain-containing protein, partial [Ornithinimicrobium sp.]
VSTYLAKGVQVDDAEHESDGTHEREATSDEATQAGGRAASGQGGAAAMKTWARWRCPGDLGRRYAAASGDVNPIHVNPIAARAFGFKGTIAHGMWTHARALAALEGRLAPSHTVGIEFRKPIMLGQTVSFRAVRGCSGHDFAVTDTLGERTHMTGSVTNS